MNLSIIKITSIFPHFNERPITIADFWQVVERNGIICKNMPLIVDGYYTHRLGQDIILINENLTGMRWLHTALHELHHYLFDAPGSEDEYTFYRNGTAVDRREYRADAFALIGIMPWPELVKLTPADLASCPWLADAVRDRIAVRTHFGI